MSKNNSPEEDSVPKRLYLWVSQQHPGQRILYLDNDECSKSALFAYLHHTQVLPSLDFALIPKKEGLRELVWSETGANVKNDEPLSELYEKKDLMGSFDRGSVKQELIHGSVDFHYNGVPMRAYRFDWIKGFNGREAIFLIWSSDNDKLGSKLLEDMFRWQHVLHQEIWMFDERWQKSKELYKAIQLAKSEDLVLPDRILESMNRDIDDFFTSQKVYKDLGAAWKRGILLVGPPGNGKTFLLRTILKRHSDKPALYVKSFQTGRFSTPERGIRAIFEKTRSCAPCILIMEDLDSLVSEETRSFLLNEIDGMESNDGIIILATSNHPEKLDNAFTKRPSRFDTKYHLDNPTPSERRKFVNFWFNEKLKGHDLISPEVIKEVDLVEKLVDGSEGWSFAFLKELFISFAVLLASNKKVNSKMSPVNRLMSIFEQLQGHVNDSKAKEENEVKHNGKHSP